MDMSNYNAEAKEQSASQASAENQQEEAQAAAAQSAGKPQNREKVDENNSKGKQGSKELFASIVENKYAFVAVFLAILAIAVFMRIGMLKYEGLFEPDGFYFYTAVENAVAHHFIVQDYSPLSGFPWHNVRGEEPGTTWFSVAGYFILRYFGFSILQVMRLMPVLFGVLEVIAVYFAARYLLDSKGLGLLASFFLAISSGNIARTAALVYRGDSFISLFAIVTIIFMLASLNAENKRKEYVYALLSAITLSMGIMVWSGSPYVVATYFLAVVLLLAYSFIAGNEKLMRKSFTLSIALGFAFLLEQAYIYAHLAYGGITLSGIGFVGLYVPLLIGAAVFTVFYKSINARLSSPMSRLVLFAILAILVVIVVDATMGSAFDGIIGGGGFSVPTNVLNNPNASKSAIINTAVGITTQELQRPSFAFLFGSFNIQLFFAPLGLLLFLFLGMKFSKTYEHRIKGVKIAVSASFLVLLAYFFVTGYLQAGAIRWNSLVSLPMAIFAAYGVYVLYRLTKGVSITSTKILAAFVTVFDVLILYFAITQVSPALNARSFLPIMLSAAIVNIILAYVIVEGFIGIAKRKLDLNKVYVGFVIALLIFNIYMTAYESFTATQADGINPQFLQAMAWMKNNTPSNATVITLWPDGSVVEAWAQRQSYMDSVAGENSTRIYYFNNFLFNTSDDPQYFYHIGKPDYLIARNFWFQELGGIAQEGLVQNSSQFGIDVLSNVTISHINSTASLYSFSSNYGAGAKMVISLEPNGTQKIAAYVSLGSAIPFYEISHVLFYNSANYNYTLFNSQVSNTLNYTLMISYAGSRIGGAEILGPKLPSSNIFKFLVMCNDNSCAWDNSKASLRLVYANSDTKIFRILYNDSALATNSSAS
ncbi:MAG: STT3 domain-containing protein [Candidatus Micrarchaeia archaeon]